MLDQIRLDNFYYYNHVLQIVVERTDEGVYLRQLSTFLKEILRGEENYKATDKDLYLSYAEARRTFYGLSTERMIELEVLVYQARVKAC